LQKRLKLAGAVAFGQTAAQRLGNLPRDSFRSRVHGDVGPHQAAPVQSHDYDAIEKPEADGRHDEQIHGGDVWRVVTKESLLGLRPPSPTLGHVFGDGRLCDLKAEFEQFAVDARRSPQRVLPGPTEN
jgi:hypothetical protein